jgi:hypothetical protein
MVEYVQPDAYSFTIPAQVYPQLNYLFAIESRMHVLQSTENILMHTPDSLCLKSLSVITADKICFAARGLRLTINRRATMFRKRKKQSSAPPDRAPKLDDDGHCSGSKLSSMYALGSGWIMIW